MKTDTGQENKKWLDETHRFLAQTFSGEWDPQIHPDKLIEQLEVYNLGWSLDHNGRLIEARIWVWPYVIGRYRPPHVEPLAKMLWMAGKVAVNGYCENPKADFKMLY